MTSVRLLSTGASLLALCGATAQAADFVAQSLTETGGFTLAAPMDRVFPLFGPVREREWAVGWNPTLIYPTDREVAEGMVFTVGENEGLAYWVVTQYDPAMHTVAYVNVTPGHVVNRILVRCRAAGANETEVSVAYAHTALGESGNRWIVTLTPSSYAAKMQHWQQAITYALKHGHPMPRAH